MMVRAPARSSLVRTRRRRQGPRPSDRAFTPRSVSPWHRERRHETRREDEYPGYGLATLREGTAEVPLEVRDGVRAAGRLSGGPHTPDREHRPDPDTDADHGLVRSGRLSRREGPEHQFQR